MHPKITDGKAARKFIFPWNIHKRLANDLIELSTIGRQLESKGASDDNDRRHEVGVDNDRKRKNKRRGYENKNTRKGYILVLHILRGRQCYRVEHYRKRRYFLLCVLRVSIQHSNKTRMNTGRERLKNKP